MESLEPEEIIKLQNNIKAVIQRSLKNYKKSPKERLTQEYVETRLESLESNWESFQRNNSRLIQIFEVDDLEKSSYVLDEVYDETEELYFSYKSLMKAELNNLTIQSNARNNSEAKPKTSAVKLPDIVIPKFSGNYSDWPTFRDLFLSLVHRNSSLENVQKMQYLKCHVTGEAEQLLRQYQVTESNYSVCWALLDKRYNNKKYLCNCILSRLFSQKRLMAESGSGLKQLYDTTNDCLNALSNIDVDVKTWDIIIIHMLTFKLDPVTRREWELKVQNDPSTELPTYEQFKSFLENRYRALENLEKKGSFSNQGTPKEIHARVHLATDGESYACEYCSQSHKLCFCKKFAKLTHDQRHQFVTKNKLCYNCLGGNHSVKQCDNTATCRLCKARHHSLLHKKKEISANAEKKDQGERVKKETNNQASSSSEDTTTPKTTEGNEQVVLLSSGNQLQQKRVLLATALVRAQTKAGDWQVIRALLDQGATASFISERVVQLLRLKKHSASCKVSGLGCDGSLVSRRMVTVRIQSIIDPEVTLEVPSHVLPSITSYLPEREIRVSEWADYQHMQFADPKCNSSSKIDILLGGAVYCRILKEGLKRSTTKTLIAQDTSFGWIVSGEASFGEPCVSEHVALHAHVKEDDLLKRFWEVEEQITTDEVFLTEEERQCEIHFASTTQRTEEGRFVVKLPFKDNNPLIDGNNSREIATRRFKALEKKFSRDPNLKEKYTDVINEYISLGHMSPVKDNERNKGAVYLPHHAVVREDKTTTKVRVVFDASCKYNAGVSLNDTLMVGPTLQPDLRHILLRWRLHPIALTADIVKMYRQVRIAEEDQSFQRIVWRENPESELKDYELVTVTFGTASAPYQAVKALQQTAHAEGQQYPLAKDRVLDSFYVDDLLTGCETTKEGIEIYTQMQEMLKRGGFQLQKWNSNDKNILKEINRNEQDTAGHKGDQRDKDKEKSIEVKLETTVKILGLTWKRDDDELQYTVNLPEKTGSETKRSILSDIARLFDPLGWIAPIVIIAKTFIQKLWLAGIGWDEAVPSELLEEWRAYRSQLVELTKFHLPRWLGTKKDDAIVELHGFSDASKIAYAAVVYVRVVRSNGDVHVSLLTAKTKVAPIKQRSIPRLELCGAWLLTQMLIEMAKILRIPKENLHAWTDSTIVLAWLNKHPNQWKTFVANRVSEILMRLDSCQWSHVATKENPADCASRGVMPSELTSTKLWVNGPDFLREPTVDYKKPKNYCTHEEQAAQVHVCVVNNTLMQRYSSLRRLLRIVAYCRRFLTYKKGDKLTKYPKKTEIDNALVCCVKVSQSNDFATEITDLKEKGCIRSKDSKLKSLAPYLDDKGILKVGGRLQRSSLGEGAKHPIVLSRDSPLTKLLIGDAHEKTMHGGPQLMMNWLRTAYWIVGVKNLVKQHVRQCVTCVRNRAEFKNQYMASLPSVRVTPARPFINSGVDYAGPIQIRTTKGRGHKSYKGYVCLFVCMSTRAIHLEVVSDMTAQAFIAAFRRFVARRGHCSKLFSDNGTNFVGAARELKELADIQQSIIGQLEVNGTEWHFIPPHAPNFGGLWEAGIKSTKHHLKRVIGDTTLTYEEMSTLLSQVEACLNSRPMTVINTEDPGEPEPLTPGHFLIGQPLVTAVDASHEHSSISSLTRWQAVQKMLQNFWRRWSEEYLTTLMHRYKWKYQVPEPKIGDVVLIKEDDLPPSRWLLGRVMDKHPGPDNVTRVVTIKTKTSVIKRPTSRLCILPVAD